MEQPRLLDQVRNKIRLKHYSLRTEEAYAHWVKRFVLFHNKRHPRDMSATEVEQFLTALAVQRKVSASTQNQAKNALLFLYKEVLDIQLPWLDKMETAKRPKYLPVVLTVREVNAMLEHTAGTPGLILRLVYGTGMRINECLSLRVKDVDFERHEILIRDGKGFKDRITMLPQSTANELREHMKRVELLHRADLRAGYGEVLGGIMTASAWRISWYAKCCLTRRPHLQLRRKDHQLRQRQHSQQMQQALFASACETDQMQVEPSRYQLR